MYLRCTSRMHFFLIMEMVEFPYPNCNSLWTHLHMALLESVHYTKHFLNESLRSLRFRFLPMKTNLLVRVSPGAQGLPWPVADDPIPSIMWTPWKTCRWGLPWIARSPFERKISFPNSWRSVESHISNMSMSHSPSHSMPTLWTDSSCWWSWSGFKNSGSISIILSNSKARISKISWRGTRDCVVSKIDAGVLMALIRFFTASSSFGHTRSNLLRMIRSANAICSTDSFSTPSSFSSSKCWRICFASTTVIIPSSLVLAYNAKEECVGFGFCSDQQGRLNDLAQFYIPVGIRQRKMFEQLVQGRPDQ